MEEVYSSVTKLRSWMKGFLSWDLFFFCEFFFGWNKMTAEQYGFISKYMHTANACIKIGKKENMSDSSWKNLLQWCFPAIFVIHLQEKPRLRTRSTLLKTSNAVMNDISDSVSPVLKS